MRPRALRRALLRALLPAALGCALLAAPASALTADSEFPAGGVAMRAALWAGTAYWGTEPCGGRVEVVWADLERDANAMSYWTTPGPDPWAAPEQNGECRIEFNRAIAYDWPMLCTVSVHEVGHLLGRSHSDTPGDVMSEVYRAPLPGCVEAAQRAGLAPAPPPAAQASGVRQAKRIRGEGARRYSLRRSLLRTFRSRA